MDNSVIVIVKYFNKYASNQPPNFLFTVYAFEVNGWGQFVENNSETRKGNKQHVNFLSITVESA